MFHYEVEHVSQIAEALESIARVRPKVLVINGGDGTVQATLTELPYEPGRTRRKRQHDDYLSLYREIRKYLPNGPTKTRVVEEFERAFREVEILLGLTRESEWWSE